MKVRFDIHLINGLLWAYAATALTVFAATWATGPTDLELLRFPVAGIDLNLGLRFDFLSTLLFVMVTALGAMVGQYGLRYLAGEPRQSYFYHWLLATLTSVCLLMLANNLLMVFLMWVATSWGLHQLLTYYPDRWPAVMAARKKFLISRLGALGLLAGIILIYMTFGTLQFSELFALSQSITPGSNAAMMLSAAGFCFVLGAMTKSAQFPFHFWLPETMETPAPVSALMHAGIINAGGFLVIRLSPLLQHAEAAHLLLILMGAFTAVFGALVMITQNDIKKKLAYSTVSQMGMMMLACGLGAYSVALFHMIAHSFYKAHAFLSTGMIVEEGSHSELYQRSQSNLRLLLASVLGLIVMGVASVMYEGTYFSYATYAAILLLGLMQNGVDGKIGAGRNLEVAFHVAAIMIVAATAFALLEFGINHNLNPIVADLWDGSPWQSGHALVGFVAYSLFVAGVWLSAHLERLPGLYLYLWNGGYLSVITHRFFRQYSTSPEQL